MTKTTITAVQFFASLYQDLGRMRSIFASATKDKRFPDMLRFDFENAEKALDDCFIATENVLKHLLSNDLPEPSHENAN